MVFPLGSKIKFLRFPNEIATACHSVKGVINELSYLPVRIDAGSNPAKAVIGKVCRIEFIRIDYAVAVFIAPTGNVGYVKARHVIHVIGVAVLHGRPILAGGV